jgi:hypothetical protein
MQLFKMTSLLLGVFVTIGGMFVGGQSHAATLLGTTNPALGINGLEVDGVTYNVTFDGSEITTAFLGNSTEAAAAASALATALNNFGVSSIFYAPPPGVYANFYILIPETLWIAPTSPQGPYDQNYGKIVSCLLCADTHDWQSSSYVLSNNLNSGPPRITYANFTALSSPVPVPAAAWLLGSGLLGLIGVARRKAA